MEDPQLGAALLSARSGAPLLPVALVNTHRAFGPKQRWPRPWLWKFAWVSRLRRRPAAAALI